ncbi:glycosyl transferase group 1/2 family protein [Dulcicalothrix desertica PCC 7102]|uniref:Glycosyl transferase group 1/2 family protein n=1 Tax=Dulcicalothrix desertica PCC 7102 TaxID=232991 RepID=A0A433V2D7_9CYAN|nr:glycosyltransferase [Dulcicalothrix desertica]RUT00238.1 glycosyl transferase group 1/2 family protein [Dulcicalothrix desertica PCC 7102]TWH55705.1 glycosyltransferase involved in cell wall biosynthesis [Dulcicalothrix desertica PCC 7102]
MKVAIISKSDRKGGGASRVAEDLAIWLNEAGHYADHFIAMNCKEPESFQHNVYGKNLNLKICKKIHKISYKYGFPEIIPIEYFLNHNQFIDKYDVIHFHDLYTAISPLTLALTSRHKPTFFTIHDCSAFTGGCLYPMDCNKFISNCYQCPQLPIGENQTTIPDHTREIQVIKRWIANKFSIKYIFPSHWMLQEAQKVLDFKLEPILIPYGLDLKPFLNISRPEAKTRLGVPENRKVITLSAHVLHDPRKGVKYAISAIKSVCELSPFIIVVGICNDELRQALNGFDIRETGFISNQNDLALAYIASDLIMFCTLADNLPLTILEAMAASTPVVAFATGGVPEMIQNGRNSILVQTGDQLGLNQALRKALLSDNLHALGQQARKDVENNFSKKEFINKHLRLYQNISSVATQETKGVLAT